MEAKLIADINERTIRIEERLIAFLGPEGTHPHCMQANKDSHDKMDKKFVAMYVTIAALVLSIGGVFVAHIFTAG